MGATVAVKRIPKAKVRSLVALRNLANEVNAMRALTDARAAAAGGGGGDGGETAEAACLRGVRVTIVVPAILPRDTARRALDDDAASADADDPSDEARALVCSYIAADCE